MNNSKKTIYKNKEKEELHKDNLMSLQMELLLVYLS